MEGATTCTECDAPAALGKSVCPSCEAKGDSSKSSRPSGVFEQIPGGRYEIEACLGTGAFGSVYKALDTFLSRPVAVKSIRLDTSLDPDHRKALNKRFIREAQVAAQLHHPNIVTIHDILFTPETGFIVMEFIEGRTLQSVLAKDHLPLKTAVDVTAQIASALQYAHEHKIIHRDVKPANIMITPRYEARITDFGIAKSDEATQLTMSGSLVGTPDYMSPEQAKGEDVDARSDLFSLGCVLYECALGQKPFKGGSLTGVLLNIVNTDPLAAPAWKSFGAPPELDQLMKRALAKEPEERFSSAEELLQALRALRLPDADGADPVIETSAEGSDDEAIVVFTGDGEDAAAAEERLCTFKEESRPLKFAATLSDELQDMSLTPAQGFILSRIDGASLARDIIALSPLPEVEVADTLAGLIDKGLLTWGEAEASSDTNSGDSATRRPASKVKSKSKSPPKKTETKAAPVPLDDDLEREMERILELATEERYGELLGVEDKLTPSEVKHSYLELIEKFHPEAQSKDIDPEARKKLSKVCAVATEALTVLSPRSPATPAPPKAPPKPAPVKRSPIAPAGFDRSSYADELFHLAQKAYEITDYWEAIQLARQAIELDDQRAEYHYLLGLGLMKNRNWLKEAEECLRKATELDPTKAEYFGELATVYKAEGLSDRYEATLEKAKALDPTSG